MPSLAPSDLPPLAAAPVPRAARWAYVLRHFRLAYPEAPDVAIGPTGSGAAVEVVEGAGDFFTQTEPQPTAPAFREWGGQSVPFFFADDVAPLLRCLPGRAVIGVDIVSAAFFLLSGWQEYFSAQRDAHGRFPYAASVQHRFGFVTLPVVNYYFDLLKAAVEHVSGQPLQPRRWGPQQAPFAACITHDIDSLHGGWGTAARHALRRGQLGKLTRLVWDRATGRPAPWHNLATVQAAAHGAPGTFFMLAQQPPAPNGVRNADYDYRRPAIRQELETLRANGAEIALHGSYGTAHDPDRLRAEAAGLGPPPVAGNRFHYLSWEPRRTPAVLAAAGLAYDSTLGFAEHYGFRHAYCHPFFPFDFERGEAHEFLEIPLLVMDTTLHHPNYLQLTGAEILPALRPLLAEVERFGGVATVLWHNNSFAPGAQPIGPQQFGEIMGELRQRGAAFVTGSDLCRALR